VPPRHNNMGEQWGHTLSQEVHWGEQFEHPQYGGATLKAGIPY